MAFNPPVIDDFTGANGSINGRTTVPGGQTWSSPLFTGHSAGQIVSNSLAGSGAQDRSGVVSSADFGPDTQLGITITTWVSSDSIILFARIQQDSFPVSAGAVDCYYGFAASGGGLTIHSIIGGSNSTVGTIGSHSWTSGDKVGMEIYESAGSTKIDGYFDSGGGWTTLGTGLTDSTGGRPTTAGHVGFEIDTVAAVLDDLLAQTTPAGVTGVAWIKA